MSPSSRISRWRDVTVEELRVFFGVMLHMKFLKEFHIYSTRSNNLAIPSHRLTKCRTSSNYYAIRFYNTLPVEFRDLQNKQCRTLLKSYLISKAYYTLQEFFEDSFLELKLIGT
jgi:O-phosphoseryl-tRNA(Cys) synthetase